MEKNHAGNWSPVLVSGQASLEILSEWWSRLATLSSLQKGTSTTTIHSEMFWTQKMIGENALECVSSINKSHCYY